MTEGGVPRAIKRRRNFHFCHCVRRVPPQLEVRVPPLELVGLAFIMVLKTIRAGTGREKGFDKAHRSGAAARTTNTTRERERTNGIRVLMGYLEDEDSVAEAPFDPEIDAIVGFRTRPKS